MDLDIRELLDVVLPEIHQESQQAMRELQRTLGVEIDQVRPRISSSIGKACIDKACTGKAELTDLLCSDLANC